MCVCRCRLSTTGGTPSWTGSGVLVDGVAVAVAVSADHAALGVADDFDVPALVRLVLFGLTNDVDLVRRLASLPAHEPGHFGPEAAYSCFGRLVLSAVLVWRFAASVDAHSESFSHRLSTCPCRRIVLAVAQSLFS